MKIRILASRIGFDELFTCWNATCFLRGWKTRKRTKRMQLPLVPQIQCDRPDLITILAKLAIALWWFGVTDDSLVLVFTATRAKFHGIFPVRFINIVLVPNHLLTIFAHANRFQASDQTFFRAKMLWLSLNVFHVNEWILYFDNAIAFPTTIISMTAIDRWFQTIAIAKIHQMPSKECSSRWNVRITFVAPTSQIPFTLFHQLFRFVLGEWLNFATIWMNWMKFKRNQVKNSMNSHEWKKLSLLRLIGLVAGTSALLLLLLSDFNSIWSIFSQSSLRWSEFCWFDTKKILKIYSIYKK